MRSHCKHAALLCSALIVICAPGLAAAAPGDVKSSFDTPCKYPAGLAYDGKYFYLLDWRDSKIYQITPADGKVAATFDAPCLRPQGLAYGDKKLFVSDERSGWVYALNLESKLVEYTFEAPGPQPTGLAYGDEALFILERKSGQISKVIPKDGTILAYILTPTDTCTGLTYDGKHLWVSDRVKNELYMVDPVTGMVLGIMDAPGPYAAGLAWVDGYLWNADFQTRKLYQLVVKDEQKYRLTEPREARVEFLWALYNYGPSDIQDVKIAVALPGRLPNQELLSDIEYSNEPAEIVTDRWGQRCARYSFALLAGGTRRTLSYNVKAKISAIRYLILPDEAGMLDAIPADVRKTYTADGERYRITSPYIVDTVKTVVGDEKNTYWIARKIYNYLMEKIEYEMVGGWDVPEVVLKRGKGSCSESTFAFVALCRAAGLPARYQGSVVVRGDEASIDDAFHRWAEIYLPNYGWVPVDASRGKFKAAADAARGFGELSNRYLITTIGGGGSEYLEWGYNSLAQYKATGYCKVEEETYAFWEPLKSAEKAATPAAAGTSKTCQP